MKVDLEEGGAPGVHAPLEKITVWTGGSYQQLHFVMYLKAVVDEFAK